MLALTLSRPIIILEITTVSRVLGLEVVTYNHRLRFSGHFIIKQSHPPTVLEAIFLFQWHGNQVVTRKYDLSSSSITSEKSSKSSVRRLVSNELLFL